MQNKLDNKELEIINGYKEKFKNNSFDELDILGFLIFIRKYVKKYTNILEFCDLVAHRKRNQGKIMSAICKMIEKRYYISKKQNIITGLSCISEEDWLNEWNDINKLLNLNLTERNINEITMCIISLSNDTNYNNVKHKGVVKHFIDKSGYLSLCCSAGRKDSKYVCIFRYQNCIEKVPDEFWNCNYLLERDNNKNLIYVEKK